MIPPEVLKNIKKIEISTRSLVQNIFSGEYHSMFKGSGLEFSEVRKYSPGDDVRKIDKNVSARMGEPYIKLFDEERDLSLVLVVDISSSTLIAQNKKRKREIIQELAAVMAFSAGLNNDKVSLLLFSDEVEKVVKAGKGKKHAMRILRDIYMSDAKNKKTSIAQAMKFILKLYKRRSIIVIISDFYDNNYLRELKQVSRKHDVVALNIVDKVMWPKSGFLNVEDIEIGTGSSNLIDLAKVSKDSTTVNVQDKTRDIMKASRVDYIELTMDGNHFNELSKFWKKRIGR